MTASPRRPGIGAGRPPDAADAAEVVADGYLDVSFEDRMELVDFRVHERAHITVDAAICEGCSTKGCVVACPAKLFIPTADDGILFNYEQCFECGTCYMVCNEEGAITWTYPEGGFGVVFSRS